MYIFIYRLQSENFEHDHYIETGGCGLWEAFLCLYATVKGEDKVLTPQLFSKLIKSMNDVEEYIEFFTSVTKGTVKIVDIFGGANRIDIGQALSPV